MCVSAVSITITALPADRCCQRNDALRRGYDEEKEPRLASEGEDDEERHLS